PDRLEFEEPARTLASDRSRGHAHDPEQGNRRYGQRAEPRGGDPVRCSPVADARELVKAECRAVDAEGEEMRRKQRGDEDHVDDETQWPWAFRQHQIDGGAPESEAQSELEV